MSKRPLSVTIIGWLYISVGCASLAGGVYRFLSPGADAGTTGRTHDDLVDLALLVASAILAIAGGAFVLRGKNWARWLCVAWMGAHVVLSLFHPVDKLIVHSVLFVVVLWVLLRPPASEYFRGGTAPV